MEFEPWWLMAIPILFTLGWLAARIEQRQALAESKALPDSYFKGLSFLLNDQSDRAIDAFIEVAKLNPETIDLHFALGNLFGRRGEIERAIRVHQSLVQREDLPAQQKEDALYALAHDYQRAGMLDRAEDAFERLQDSDRFQIAAKKGLMRIYEAERNWDRAIQIAVSFEPQPAEVSVVLVHFYCERARACFDQQPPQLDAAQQALEAAWKTSCLQLQKQSSESTEVPHVRVLFLWLELQDLRYGAELVHPVFQQIFEAYPEYAGLLANQYIQRMRQQQLLEQGLQVLTDLYVQHPTIDILQVIFETLYAIDPPAAWSFAQGAFERRPSLLGLNIVLQAVQSHPVAAKEGSDTATVAMQPAGEGLDAVFVSKLIQKQTQRFNRYVCRQCGFKAKKFHWQCPGCNHWDTYLPKRFEELDGQS